MKVGYVVLYVNDAEACRRFWVEQIGMVEKRRSEAGIFTIAQVGFADQPFAFELVPLELMKDNPDGLDLATPSIAFTVDDLEATRAALVESRGRGDGRGRSPGHGKLRLLGSRGPLVRGDAVSTTTEHRIFSMTVASVYPLYLAKVEKKGRTQDELDAVIRWLTGFDEAELERHLAAGTTFADFFAVARLNPNAGLITGVICGVRVQEIEDPLMQQIRYLDKLVDELAKGRAMEKVLRT